MIRPDQANNCPSGTQKCSILTEAQNSVCVQSLEDCPINDLEFVLTSQVQSRDSYWESAVTYANGYSLRFTTQGDMNPVTTTTTGSNTPCMKPSENTINGIAYYPIERDFVEEGCSVAQINGFSVDERYLDV